jgi:catechol 2,3-dioxygenase-like lactoylglutathione lyase family enzyme
MIDTGTIDTEMIDTQTIVRHTFCLLFLTALLPAEELPIARLAGVTFQVNDLGKARHFYGEIMGFEQAFALKDCISFHVAEDQFLEFCPGLAGDGFQVEHVNLLTPDIEKARHMLIERGLKPAPAARQADRNQHFRIADPDGAAIDFVQYTAGSPQWEARTKSLGGRRAAEHLQHFGFAASSEAAAMPFYRETLGFREFSRGGPPGTKEIRWITMMMPGPFADFIELMVQPDAAPANRRHICFEVPDIQAAYKLLLEHGEPNTFKPFHGAIRRWLMNLKDPNGLRVEFMESKITD